MFYRGTRKEDKIGDDAESRKEIFKKGGHSGKESLLLEKKFQSGRHLRKGSGYLRLFTTYRKLPACRERQLHPAYLTHRGA